MAYLRTLKNGSTQATIRLKGVTQYRTFTNKKQANDWAARTESNIKQITTLSDCNLITLSDVDIELMGGTELFSKLGIDLFSLRHAAKLETINQFSKKELLQLSAQQIESMGGAELFTLAGKRIRYKTFREVCNEYLRQWDKKDYSNQMLRVNYWSSIYGGMIMTDIDIFDIRDQVDAMLEEGQRPVTINRKKAVLSSVFKYAISKGYIDKNIVRNVIINNDGKRRDRVLTNDERTRLLKACKDSRWDRLYLLVLMALVTGARRGELLGLRWNDLSVKESIAQLSDTKNGSSRTLSFPLIVMTELKRFQQVGNGLLFESDKKPNQPKDIRKSWANALKVARISAKDILNADGVVQTEKFTFHCLRQLAINKPPILLVFLSVFSRVAIVT